MIRLEVFDFAITENGVLALNFLAGIESIGDVFEPYTDLAALSLIERCKKCFAEYILLPIFLSLLEGVI